MPLLRPLLAALLAIGVVPVEAQDEVIADERPNVIVVIADDQGWGDLSAHGNPVLATPRLDDMRARSVRFDRFYADPLCAPTRAALLTGRYPLRTGVRGVTRGGETMRSEEVTIAEVLSAAGYDTAAFGKWHNGAHYPHDARGQGFGHVFGFSAGHANHYFDAALTRDGEPVATNGYITDVVTDAAAEYASAPRQAPFFAWVAYNTPHSPFQVPDEAYERYAAAGLDPKLAAIYGMVENIDANVGRLLDTAPGNGRETVVIYLSDNGPNGARYNGGMKGTKGGVNEGSLRVPMFVLMPGAERGRTVGLPAAHIDLLPTLAGLTGTKLEADPDRPLDGIDLSGLLRSDEAEEGFAERLLFAHRTTDEAVRPTPGTVRDARYRAVIQEGAADWQLYDLRADPGQTRDLSAIFPGRTARLAAAWEDWFADVTARAPSWPRIQIGHAEGPRVALPAHEAHLDGARIRYGEPHGWSNDWIHGWSEGASASWLVDVVRPGTYDAVLRAGAEADAARLTVTLTAGDEALRRTVASLDQAPIIPAPDRIPRKEAPARAWDAVPLGALTLGPDAERLTLTITPEGAGRIDVGGLILTRRAD